MFAAQFQIMQQTAIQLKEIQNRIITIRGLQVMLDKDLADIYGVETKVLNQAVKRNIGRFPDSFRFQPSEIELNESSRSQFVTLKIDDKNEKIKRGQNIKYLLIKNLNNYFLRDFKLI